VGRALDPGGADPVALSRDGLIRYSEKTATCEQVLSQQQMTRPARAVARKLRARFAKAPRTIHARTQTLKKKALQAQQRIRNSLRMCLHVLFFGAIRYARCGPRAWVTTLEE
jgi:hypothetical protein